MPSDSVIAAVLALYDTLTPALFPGSVLPPIYFDQGPAYDGVQVYPPYVVLIDRSGTPQYTDEFDAIEYGAFTVEVYGNSLAQCDAITKAIQWNGGTPAAAAGFDFTKLSLNPPLYGMASGVIRGQSQAKVSGIGKENQRVYLRTTDYTTKANVRSGG